MCRSASTSCSCLLIAAIVVVVQSHSDSYGSAYWDPDGVHDEAGAKSWWDSYSSHPHGSAGMYLEDGVAALAGLRVTRCLHWSLVTTKPPGFGFNLLVQLELRMSDSRDPIQRVFYRDFWYTHVHGGRRGIMHGIMHGI